MFVGGVFVGLQEVSFWLVYVLCHRQSEWCEVDSIETYWSCVEGKWTLFSELGNLLWATRAPFVF